MYCIALRQNPVFNSSCRFHPNSKWTETGKSPASCARWGTRNSKSAESRANGFSNTRSTRFCPLQQTRSTIHTTFNRNKCDPCRGIKAETELVCTPRSVCAHTFRTCTRSVDFRPISANCAVMLTSTFASARLKSASACVPSCRLANQIYITTTTNTAHEMRILHAGQ